MIKESNKLIIWPAISATLIFGFVYLFLFICASLKFSFESYVFLVIGNVFLLPLTILFLELSGCAKKIWKFWKSLPLIVHQGTCIFCGFWICWISFKGLIPSLKKEYDKN